MPALAEELTIERDIRLLDYVLEGERSGGGREGGKGDSCCPLLHFSTISTARSVELIRRAKAAGLPVSCDVAVHQLVFDDSALAEFDTNLKVNPPFRSLDDVAALWAGLADDTIDAIVSDHSPQDAESKNLEFDQAEFGIIGLETAFAASVTHNRLLPLSKLIGKFTIRPRQILRLPSVSIAEGQAATLTLFDPTQEWTYERTVSKSKNSPFLGQLFTGRVVGTIHRGLFNPIP